MDISQLQKRLSRPFRGKKKKVSQQLTLNKDKSLEALLTLPTTLHSCLWAQLTGWQTFTDVTLTRRRDGSASVTVQQALVARPTPASYSLLFHYYSRLTVCLCLPSSVQRQECNFHPNIRCITAPCPPPGHGRVYSKAVPPKLLPSGH